MVRRESISVTISRVATLLPENAFLIRLIRDVGYLRPFFCSSGQARRVFAGAKSTAVDGGEARPSIYARLLCCVH